MYTTIGRLFDLTVKNHPKRMALVDVPKQKRWTYEELRLEVNRLANAMLDAGVEKGDRVSTFLFNASELATVFFASAKIGAVLNPINFRLKSNELSFILEDAKPKIVLFENALESVVSSIQQQFDDIQFWYIDEETPSYAENYHTKVQQASETEPSADVTENDLYAIMYTSGTTGRPKGVMHRHRDMVEQSLICSTTMNLTPEDKGLVTAPMFHCAELHCCFLPRVHVGASNIIVHHFDPKEVLKVIEEEKITVFFGAPTMWNMLLQENLEQYDLSSLRVGLYGAAPMAPTLVRACKEKLGIQLIQAYGMTEMGPAITFLYDHEQLTKAGSAGKACLNHEIRVVRTREDAPSEPDDILPPGEIGEIIVQGPCIMTGYYHREEATEKSMYKGWYHSSDLGYLDADGYLYVADRMDDMIISGGENIYPRQIEDILYEHKGVLDVAVFGEPHEKWGEQVIAVVVKKDESLTAEELDLLCKNSDHLANYKRPRKYFFVDVLPRNASGKIQKFVLREQWKEKVQ